MRAKTGRLARFLGVGSAGFLMLSALASFPEPRRDRPRNAWNVLMITIDTLRADRLGCYGAASPETPVLDSLAARGALFERAFAHTPTTLPSHANILLGTTPLSHGVHDNANFVVDAKLLTLASHLKSQGYETAAFVGGFPLDSRFGLTGGFDVYDDHCGTPGNQEFTYTERKAEVVVDRALSWLESRARDANWFLWVHCFDPHQRYMPPEPFLTRYKDRPYDGEIAYVDHSLGRLMRRLAESGFDRNTLIVFTGDHGESLGQHGESTHGYFAYNATLHIPLIVAYPGIKPVRVGQNVGHIDIFPTVCDALGTNSPDGLQGLSLLPAIRGRKLAARSLYFESLYPYYSRGWAPLQGFFDGTRKFVDSPIPELYDLAGDFDEKKNLAGSTDLRAFRDELGRLISRLSAPSLSAGRKVDRRTRELLGSLGYVSSPQALAQRKFTAQDDLKVLLPFQARLQKAMGAYHAGRLDEAEEVLREVVSERGDFDLAYSYLATVLKDRGRWKEAVAVLRDGADRNPRSFKILSAYGILLVEARAYDAAVEILGRAIDLIDTDPDAWNYLGVAYYHKGSFDEALLAYERALALDDNYPVVINNLGSLHLAAFLKTGDRAVYEQAVACYRRAIDLDPNYSSAYNGLGVALRQAGDMAGAIANWEKAVEIKPDQGFALYNLGLAYLQKGDTVRALARLTEYKDLTYGRLTAAEKVKLDELIARCK